MEGVSRKRPSPNEEGHDHQARSKRQRTMAPEAESTAIPAFSAVNRPTAEDLGRDGLRRSIALTLKQVGFDSASKDALEGFTETVDTYITGFVEQLMRTANAARRVDPTPVDFESILHQHNVPLSSLKPHLKNPVPKEQLEPALYDPITEDVGRLLQSSRLFLGDELDGKAEKEEKAWIPKSFPDFPSKHSYKYTPVEETARDTQSKRAEAAADARKGEMALRRIDRAAKISRQKELKEVAQRNPLIKQRHEAWEDLMKNLVPARGGVSGATEMADHSTIVNAAAKYGRKEVPRTSRRAPVDNQG
ncbi:Uu.00g104420.m01.CDS01 [Anthostomella pinea]|uniref:Transcription initiation factor TFIID subunit 8 n=1 Tax=Anthostomella pinea TaxID=933095 RepID=A0AAI8VDT3_9PEZI|nr:Uu.00g104420.m01.CDS01 [Anthostomella pinea]